MTAEIIKVNLYDIEYFVDMNLFFYVLFIVSRSFGYKLKIAFDMYGGVCQIIWEIGMDILKIDSKQWEAMIGNEVHNYRF